jgi:hypothetical protein
MTTRENLSAEERAQIAREVEELARVLGPTLAVWTCGFSLQDGSRAGVEIASAVLAAGYRRPSPAPAGAPR